MRNKLKAAGDAKRVPIDRYLSDLPSPQKEICLSLRSLMTRLSADVEETLKWGCPCYSFQGRKVASIMPSKQSVNLALFRGNELADPEGLIEGNDASFRYVRLDSTQDIKNPSLRNLVRQALELGETPVPALAAAAEQG